MAGIISYGAYIPFNRLDRRLIREMYGNPVPKGEKAVANFDEDSLTMAVAAALDCTSGFRGDEIDRLYFATTTPPHREKQAAPTIAGTLDMKSQALTLDVTGSLRSGSSALIAGLDAAEKGEKVMVTISDSRLGAAAGQFEALLGDGAAAFMLGAERDCRYNRLSSISADFYDNWRSSDDRRAQLGRTLLSNPRIQRFTVEAQMPY